MVKVRLVSFREAASTLCGVGLVSYPFDPGLHPRSIEVAEVDPSDLIFTVVVKCSVLEKDDVVNTRLFYIEAVPVGEDFLDLGGTPLAIPCVGTTPLAIFEDWVIYGWFGPPGCKSMIPEEG